MSHFILASEIILFTSAGLRIGYLKWQKARTRKFGAINPIDECEAMLGRQSQYGYNEHSLVGVSCKRKAWFDDQTDSALNYSEHGLMWLVAGETMAADEHLVPSTRRFLDNAHGRRKLAAFLPASEKFARAVAGVTDLKVIKIGATPCFDLQTWNPRGNKSKSLRAGLSQARRAQISFAAVETIKDGLRDEVTVLCEKWLGTRRSGIKFGWLFELSPFQNSAQKKFFTARDPAGRLVGFLAASPIPARDGWYLEDVLRAPDAPSGTAELLVFETLRLLAGAGAKFATLGTAPLATDGEDTFGSSSNFFSRKLLTLSRRLNCFYNFQGIRNFKAKFVPTHWESEYVLLPKGLLTPLLLIEALLFIVLREQ